MRRLAFPRGQVASCARVNPKLPSDGLDYYCSASQRARVATEVWARHQLYCIECPAATIQAAPPNAPGRDLLCPGCGAAFEMKARGEPFGLRVLDSGYNAMLASLRADRRAHLLLLEYHRTDWTVRNLELVPGFALVPAMIVPRRPLSEQARRAGWVGCLIDLRPVPADARVALVRDGRPAPAADCRERFARIRGLGREPLRTRGWTLEVWRAVRELGRREFCLGEMYALAPRLSARYPANRHQREKIRQQMQVLRDLGVVEFLGRGRYRVRAV